MEPTPSSISPLKKFFMVLGIIFAVLIVLAIGGAIALLYFKHYGIDVSAPFRNTAASSTYDHPYLSTQQEKTLSNIGIDPATLPTSITREQAEFAIGVVGQKRADEIMAGATPTIAEVLAAKKCL